MLQYVKSKIKDVNTNTKWYNTRKMWCYSKSEIEDVNTNTEWYNTRKMQVN